MDCNPTKSAIKAAGGALKVARHFGVSYQAVYGWSKVPADKVLRLCSLGGWAVLPEQLRPDVFTLPAGYQPQAPEA